MHAGFPLLFHHLNIDLLHVNLLIELRREFRLFKKFLIHRLSHLDTNRSVARKSEKLSVFEVAADRAADLR